VRTFNELFKVKNYEDFYVGSSTLANATTISDNSVFAEVGTDLGPGKVAETAQRMGIDSTLGSNPAILLGGLKKGVTPLEMAYAYTAIANEGKKISGSLGSRGNGQGPVAISRVEDQDGNAVEDDLGSSGINEVTSEQVIEPSTAETTKNILRTVITSGTGRAAAVSNFAWGKTGTTDDNADAWFCGSTEAVTACVWVGFADEARSMKTEFRGRPVDGGTIPANIWSDVIEAYIADAKADEAVRKAERQAEQNANAPDPTAEAPIVPATEEAAPSEESPDGGGGANTTDDGGVATDGTGGSISPD
jgi:penicillin-binding protein 1A